MALLARLYRLVRMVQGLEHCLANGVFAAVFHLEGAKAVDPEFELLEVLYGVGLRPLGPVWSRPDRFGTGVPFKIPSSPDVGPGLTDLGRELVTRGNDLGVLSFFHRWTTLTLPVAMAGPIPHSLARCFCVEPGRPLSGAQAVTRARVGPTSRCAGRAHTLDLSL